MASRSIKHRASAKKKHSSVGALAVLTVFLSVIAICAIGAFALANSWVSDLKDYDVVAAAELNTTKPTEVYAADKTTLLARFQLENREPVELDQISPYVIEGTVATEDERFYKHGGFDPAGIARAVVVNLTGAGREGASTITQQFVRNTILADEMDEITFKRKVREIYLSIKLEQEYSKEEILLMYLNTINYGNGTYGVQAAAQRYFSKDASELTLAESAALIGIPQSPTYNEPINNLDNCLERRALVLDRMLSNGCISQGEHDEANAEELVLDETIPSNDGILAYPHFTSYVRNTLLETYSTDEVFKGGLTVYTTLDVDTQKAAEKAVKKKEQGLDAAVQGSLVAIEPKTGYVKALVGGKDYYKNETNLATGQGTNGGRPCGSAFKTFTLVTALEEGISPQTTVDCVSPAVIPNTEYTSSNPLKNIDNINYGVRSIQRAFAVSSNTGFVRLQMSLGADKVIDTAEKMGITSELKPYASLTLGQQNVTMLDMANAYATIANGGTHHEAQPIYQVYDYKGDLIVDNSEPEGERVISSEVAHAATEVMKTVVNTSEGTGQEARLSNGQEVAAKTGTSSSYMDITFCGITPQLSVAVWFGDPNNNVQLPSHLGAADVFSDFMNQVLKGQSAKSFPDAKDPKYSSSYYDETYHIGGYFSTKYVEADEDDRDSSDSDDRNENNSDESSSNSRPSNNNSNNNSSSSSGGSGGTSGGSTGGSTSGGTSGGGTTSGGSGGTSGGSTGGSTSGGTSGGGTSNASNSGA